MKKGPDDRSASPRDRILEAAEQVFAEEGFAGARVDEIARRAAVNKAMLYYHVGDKRALYREVLVRNFAHMRAAVLDRVSRADGPADRLEAVVEALAVGVSELRHHPRIMLREIASGGAQLDGEVFAQIEPIVGCVRAILTEGAAAGELRATNPLLTHLTIVGAVVFMLSVKPLVDRARTLVPDEELEQLPDTELDLAHFVHDLLLNGLASRRSEGDNP
jgi:AcrR family transcriptional regulator